MEKAVGRQFLFKHKMLSMKQVKSLGMESTAHYPGVGISILQVLVGVKCSHCFLWTGSCTTLGSSDFKMTCETDKVT